MLKACPKTIFIYPNNWHRISSVSSHDTTQKYTCVMTAIYTENK